ncbi:tRNA lysidine(34) synthetase TilS [Tenacibaculum sp. SZ-18]|uniref:tRNA lysidine(34) synthetase TilS n=1 Tax=Tenacibaculum sp. SZ-18 TaxID=754423 RepID=UPI000C2D344C|nr:tRNA lysidine(34) synthetase TilS [Tenacibaculum sp. SZ-18]AUC14024.1 tRNA lysidine(34) synthetase TilS [Tenacibaculum sp. SZ-18]
MLLKRFKEHLSLKFSCVKNKSVLVAASGGVDSVALIHLLHSLGVNIVLAHCNFQLRGEASDLDESLVRKIGKELNVKTYVKRFNTNEIAKHKKLSIQIAARNLRYNWFFEICENHNIDFIATAHHADDNLETFLINLSRGSGLDGLLGIPENNGKIIRPLLPFSKEAIIEYAKNANFIWREDESNEKTKYTRNKIRHQVIPVLKSINPSLLKNFTETINHLSGSRNIIDEKVVEISTEIIRKEDNLVKIEIDKMLKLSDPKAFLYEILKGYNFTEWNNIYNLLQAQSGKIIRSKSHILLKDRGFLLLRELELKPEEKSIYYIEENTTEIVNPIKITFKNTDKKWTVSKNYVLVNKNLVTFPIILRKWEEGDFFYPTGMIGKKKVSKFFKDEKLSKFRKEQTWLLCNATNEIIWIVGMRLDRRFSIDSFTSDILQISI